MGPNLRKKPLLYPQSQNFNSGNTGAQKSALGWALLGLLCLVSRMTEEMWRLTLQGGKSVPEGRQKQT